jgi:hypothetical protein
MDKDEALQMCLEYIETDAHERKYVRHAIKAALAQPAQEPKRGWVGLTLEDILGLFDEHNLYGSKLVEFARAVETKLKEKNNAL